MKETPASFGRSITTRNRPLESRSAVMLTPLVDIFTILLIFLLMSYSTSGHMTYMAQSVLMPESLTREQLEPAVEISVSTDRIYVDGDVILDDLSEWYETDKLLIPALYETLKLKAVRYRKMEESVPLFRFTGVATVQADKVIPFQFLKKVLYTVDRAEFPNISLAVFQKD